MLVSCSYARLLKLWDVTSGRELKTLKDHTDAVFQIAFSPDGAQLASASADRTIRIWELGEREGRQVYSLIAHEDAINQLAFSPDGRLLVTTGAERRIKFWRLSNPAAGLREAHPSELLPDWIYALSFTPDGKRLAARRHDGSLLIYDPVSGRLSGHGAASRENGEGRAAEHPEDRGGRVSRKSRRQDSPRPNHATLQPAHRIVGEGADAACLRRRKNRNHVATAV